MDEQLQIILHNSEIGTAEMNMVDPIWEDELAYLLNYMVVVFR